MNREVHVRIWERPEVRVLRATRQQRPITTLPAAHLAREYVTAAVRGPKRIVKTDKTPMLEAVEWRKIE